MKLKKIASLALAGIMAVSMLAGCNAASSSSSENTAPATGLVGKVIENLDEDVTKKVTFNAGSDLQTALNEMVTYYGSDKSMTNLTAVNLKKFDDDIKIDKLPDAQTDSQVVGTDGDEQNTTVVVKVSSSDTNESYVANKIADAIEKAAIHKTTTNGYIVDLPVKGGDLKSSSTATTADCYYTFTYTGEVAVAEVDDSVNHSTVYVVALTVTRTPAKNDL